MWLPPCVDTPSLRAPVQTYLFYPDDGNGLPWRAWMAGDTRAGVAPFLAAQALGTKSWKWMLYGDDDTLW